MRRNIVRGETDLSDYIYHFASHQLEAAPETFYFDEAQNGENVVEVFERILGVDDFESFLEVENTLALIVIQDDAILYEKYFNGTQWQSLLISFSVLKSFASALIGIAIEDGYITSANAPITDYLPKLA